MPHDPALAGGVHALDDEQHARDRAVLRAGEQAFLQLGEAVAAGGERRRPRRLAAVEARRRPRVDVREPEPGPDPQQVGEPLRTAGSTVDSAFSCMLSAFSSRAVAFDAALAAFFALAMPGSCTSGDVSRCGGGRRGAARVNGCTASPSGPPAPSAVDLVLLPDSDRATGGCR